ncbi:MAG TPA: type III pantothenate kinase [Gemmataceae bacterium]|nr:type III pantothenate kinase [Gemmataceae bacterium]
MIPDVVADIGNSGIKWGLCAGGQVERMARLPPKDPDAWQKQAQEWNLASGRQWTIASVNRQTLAEHAEWLRGRGDTVRALTSWKELSVRIQLKQPEGVGLDRLLNAMAAKDRAKGSPVLIVDAGSAVTVDMVDATGSFLGGAIFPGCRLMTKALHDYTDALPQVDIGRLQPVLPGISSEGAIKAGVFWAVAGGITSLLYQMGARTRFVIRQFGQNPVVFLTGGDAELLQSGIGSWGLLWPEMTLEGIRIAAEELS